MKNILIFIFLTMSLIIAKHCSADFPITFAKITCIPEINYFAVEEESIYEDVVFKKGQWNDTEGKEERLNLWKNHGYFEVTKLSYQCNVSGSNYNLEIFQYPEHSGMCGSPGEVVLSLFKNDNPIIKEVYFGDSGGSGCPSGLIKMFSISYQFMYLGISKDIESPIVHKWLSLDRLKLITTERLRELAESKSIVE